MENLKFTNDKSTRQKGSEGERLAEEFLLQKGYKIIKKNFTFGKLGEIDIIAKDKGVLVFVEVKSSRTKEFGSPLERINYGKVKQLKKTAEGYLYINKINNQDCRFDIIAIDFTSGKPEITHLVNAIF